MKEIEVLINVCSEGVSVPVYAREGDAGMDVSAACEVLIRPGETVAVPTGLKVAIPEGYEIQVRPRSGISLNTPLRISNSPGTIDSGFRDEIKIIITNTCRTGGEGYHGVASKGNVEGTYRILPGDRIAQFVLKEVPVIKWKEVCSVDGIGNDRKGGFGSTGID